MLVDSLVNSADHRGLGLRIAAGLEFLTDRDLTALQPGRHEILGDQCYALVEEYATTPLDGRRWEAHREHIDIQCVVTGREKLGCASLSDMRSIEYDPSIDLEFLEFMARPDGQFRVIEAGTFAILYPDDAHMPGVAVAAPETVRKVVVKVLV